MDEIIFPDNTKYYKKIGAYDIFIIEEKPSMRLLTFQKSLLHGCRLPNERKTPWDGNIQCYVSLPYVVFAFVFFERSSLSEYFTVFYRTEPLRSMDDYLCESNLPNVSNGKVCLGDFSLSPSSTLASKVEFLIQHFWSSSFNEDIRTQYYKMTKIEPKLTTLAEWIKNSADDPAFVLKVAWPVSSSLRNLVTPIQARFGKIQVVA